MDLLLEVAREIRSAVLPHLGRAGMRSAVGTSVGGDPTFRVDEVAERAAERVLEAAGDGVAWYTEDRGLVRRGRPGRILVVDPIDGTRPGGAGLEAACVSVAAAPYGRSPVLGDVDDGLVLEIKTGTLYRARRGRGAVVVGAGSTCRPRPSEHRTVEGAFWTYGLRGRPALASVVVLEELLDGSGVSGGCFELGSAAFGMCGVATGRFDAYVDHGQRLVEDVPATRPLFERLAAGAVLNNNPYDVAAALLVCTEAGCVATDARGRPLEDRPLVGSGDGYLVSAVVAATPDLHRAIVSALDRGIDRVREVMGA